MLKKVIPILILTFGLLFVLIYFQSTKNSSKKGVLSGSGTIEAIEVEISSKLAGRIEVITKEEGDLVQKGELLVQLEHKKLSAQLKVAEADAVRRILPSLENLFISLVKSRAASG